MKALWIRVEAHEVDSVRIEQLAEALEVDLVTALGHYVALGGAIAEHSPEGIIADISDAKIERWAHWSGKRGRLAAAVRAQLQNDDGEFSEWEDSMGKLVERRAADRVRQEERRQRLRAARDARRDAEKGGKRPPTVRGQSTDNPPNVRGPSLEKGQKSGATERNGTNGTDGKSFKSSSNQSGESTPAAAVRSVATLLDGVPAGVRQFWSRHYGRATPERQLDVAKQLRTLLDEHPILDDNQQRVWAYSDDRLERKCLEVVQTALRDPDSAIVVLCRKLGDTSDVAAAGALPGQREAAAFQDDEDSSPRSSDPWPTTIGDTVSTIAGRHRPPHSDDDGAP